MHYFPFFCTQPFLEMVYGGKRSRRTDIPVAVLEALNGDKKQRGEQVGYFC